MYKLALISLLALSSLSINYLHQSSVVAQTVVQSDLIIIPGVRVGKITRNTTYTQLVTMFGKAKLNSYYGIWRTDENERHVTKVSDGNRSFSIIWKDKKRNLVHQVGGIGSAYRTPEGIRIGTTLSELKQKLGRFRFHGFGWDYSGLVLLKNTKLAKYDKLLEFQIEPQDPVREKDRESYRRLGGDSLFDSNSPDLLKLNPRVSNIEVFFSTQN